MEVQEGGKIIGQGTYGCVFSPPLLCQNRDGLKKGHANRLGKISHATDITREVEAAVNLQGKPFSHFFILPDTASLCKPAKMSEQVDKDVQQCEALEKFKPKDMYQYEMKYGGQSIRVMYNKPTVQYPFLKVMDDLLQIGAALVVNQYIHNDIHLANILVGNEGIRLIDFGRSFSASNITEKLLDTMWTSYGPEFPFEPPDMSLMNAVHHNISIEVCVADIYEKKSSMKNLESLLGISRSEQIQELMQFWTTSTIAQKQDWTKFWKTYWPTVDAWSIGSCLIELLRMRMFSQEFHTGEWENHKDIIEGVIKGLLHSSPKKRLDCLEALALFNPTHQLVSGVGARWLKVKHARTTSNL